MEKACQKISKWPNNLRPKSFRNDSLEKVFESKALLSTNTFHTNALNFPKIQTVVKTCSSMPGASNLAIWVFSISGILQVLVLVLL